MVKLFLIAGAIFGGTSVALGAFGAHALKNYFLEFPRYHQTYLTAVSYQMSHGLALLAIAWCASKGTSRWFKIAGIAMIVGVLLFSGTLYLLSLTQISLFGMITPIGGISMLIGWSALIWGAWREF